MKYLRGLAVPYNQPAALYEPPIGAYYETFRPGSLTADLANRTIPLLVGHQNHETVGKVRKTWETDDGFMFEATLLHSRADYVSEQVDEQLADHLSIGFTINPNADEWFRTSAGAPVVVRQQSQLREVSLTWSPCYASAVVGEIADQSTDWAEQRAYIAETKAWLAVDRKRQARRPHKPAARIRRPVTVEQWRREVHALRQDGAAVDMAPDIAPPPAPAADLDSRLAKLEAYVEWLAVRVGAVEGLGGNLIPPYTPPAAGGVPAPAGPSLAQTP